MNDSFYRTSVVIIILVTCLFQLKVQFSSHIPVPSAIKSPFTRSEPLTQSEPVVDDFAEPKIILLQSDTRPLEKNTLEYYNAVLLSYYAYLHGYVFIRFNPSPFCDPKKPKECRGYDNEPMHPIWTKVAAMRMAMKYARKGDYIFFIDSDATMDVSALHLPAHLAAPSISDWIKKLDKSILIPCDCYSYWTQVAHNTYGLPVNTGLVGLKARERTLYLLNIWWKSVKIVTPLQEWWGHDFRNQWPYEQERLTWMINTGDYIDDIEVIQKKMRNPDLKGLFSHGPNNAASKKELGEVSRRALIENFDCANIERPQLKNLTENELFGLFTVRDGYRNPGNIEITFPNIHKGPEKDEKRRILRQLEDRVYKREVTYIKKLADAYGMTEEELRLLREQQIKDFRFAQMRSMRERPELKSAENSMKVDDEPNPQEAFRDELAIFESGLTRDVCESTDRDSERWYDIISEFLLRKVTMIEISPTDLEELDPVGEWKKPRVFDEFGRLVDSSGSKVLTVEQALKKKK